MLVDWEAVVLDLEGHLRTKNSFGQRELTDLLADLRVRHRQIEDLPAKAFRLYPAELEEILSRKPASDEGLSKSQMAD